MKAKNCRYVKFRSPDLRVLLVFSRQYLLPDLVWGCQKAGFLTRTLLLGEVADEAELILRLSETVADFRPDFVLTLNNLGLDREGLVLDFFTRAEIPVLSWFVDNPFLFLTEYQGLSSPYLVFALWDEDYVSLLQKSDYFSFYLPLGGNLSRLQPIAADFVRQVGFVGNSMQSTVKNVEKKLSADLSADFYGAARDFAASGQRSVAGFLHAGFPRLFAERQALGKKQAAFDGLFYWLATQKYRTACVRSLLPFFPTVAGDVFWRDILEGEKNWQYHAPLGYYDDLFDFYAATACNLNTGSMQMKGAVNQRVFDVPLAGSFLLTDRRDQLAELFEEGLEVVCYSQVEEIADLVRFYLVRPELRRQICEKARKRILQHHGYQHRLQRAAAVLRERFCG